MDHHHEVLQELREPTKSLRRAIPETWAGFLSLHEAAMADGVVPARLKEATALAISVVKRCDGCIAYHAKAPPGPGPRRARWPSCWASPCSWTAARASRLRAPGLGGVRGVPRRADPGAGRR